MKKNVMNKMFAGILAGVSALCIMIPMAAGAAVVKCSDPNYMIPVPVADVNPVPVVDVNTVPVVDVNTIPVAEVNPVIVPVDPVPEQVAVTASQDVVRVDMHFDGLDNYYFKRETIRIYGRRLYWNSRTNSTYFGSEELIAEQHVYQNSDYYLELGGDVDMNSLRIEFDYRGKNYKAIRNCIYVANGLTANDEITSIALAFTPIESVAATAAGTCDVTCIHRYRNGSYSYNVIPQAVYNDIIA